MNSPSNPAATGSAITIFAAGAGQYTVSNGYAVTAQTPAVFIDGFYCNGIAAVIGPVKGLPGNVYQLSVFVPDPATLVNNNPDLKNFKFPAAVDYSTGDGTAEFVEFRQLPDGQPERDFHKYQVAVAFLNGYGVEEKAATASIRHESKRHCNPGFRRNRA